ncbi:hypothetical protein A3709_12825 [Halioglobus sp. HI00S01]|nr:hypothetical protein A3709_12825 [Halioglobus sp. HI00S01]
MAFSDISLDRRVVGDFVRENLTRTKINSSASIQVEITFTDAPVTLFNLVSIPRSRNLVYKFKLTKGGTVTRKLGGVDLDDAAFKILLERFSVVYVPTIRDLDNEGLKPFLALFKRSIQTGHGGREMKQHLVEIKATLSKKASSILGEQKNLVQRILNARAIELSTDSIRLDDVYKDLNLQIKDHSRQVMPMEYLGTGHQSAVIINLYKQFGESAPGKTLYLFEEPDAHLHPPTIRAIGSQLDEISESAQVLVSTHSPILLSQLGLDRVIHLRMNGVDGTEIAPSGNLGMTQSQLNHRLLKYGLRVTEALFSKLVILVEGGTDAVVIGRLLELRSGKSSDQMDFLITPAGGKENIVDIANILESLGVKWIAIFDFDAALTTSAVPLTHGGISAPEDIEVVEAIDTMLADIDDRQKRGRNARTQLTLLRNEIEEGPPELAFYENSTLQKLMESVLNISARTAATLKSAIRNKRVTMLRKILGSRGVWLMRPDLEYTLIGSRGRNLPIIDPILRGNGMLNTRSGEPSYERAVVNALHRLANEPELLVAVVDAVDGGGGFNRSDINMAVRSILEEAC